MIISLDGQSVNVPSSVIAFAIVVGGAVAAGSVMTYSGVVVLKLGGRSGDPQFSRTSKLIEVGAGPLGGVSSDCGIANSTLSLLLDMPNRSGTPPLSSVGVPPGVTENR